MPGNFDDIQVDIAKIRDYCLSQTHPRGRHKAKVFQTVLGLTAHDSEDFRQVLINAILDHPENLLSANKDLYG